MGNLGFIRIPVPGPRHTGGGANAGFVLLGGWARFWRSNLLVPTPINLGRGSPGPHFSLGRLPLACSEPGGAAALFWGTDGLGGVHPLPGWLFSFAWGSSAFSGQGINSNPRFLGTRAGHPL